MKQIIKIVLSVFIVSILYYVIYYTLWHLNVDIMDNRRPHHFLAGVYFPFIFYVIFNIKHERENKLWLCCIIYLIVCLLWESGQTMIYERAIQKDQLFFDTIGIGVGYILRRLWFSKGVFLYTNDYLRSITTP